MDCAERFCTGAGICVCGRGWGGGVCVSGNFLERVYPLVHDGGRGGFGGAAVLDPGASGKGAAVCAVFFGDSWDHVCGILYRMYCESLVGAGCLGLFADARESAGTDLSDVFRDVVSALCAGVLALRTDPGKTAGKIRDTK